MKITIKTFEVGELELHVTREAGSSLSLDKGFYTFLDRPERPHVSLFMEPKPGRSYLEPHFTAARSTTREFRAPLARIEETAFHSGLGQFLVSTIAQTVANMQPVDLDTQDAEGWTVHYLHPGAVRRWIRRGPPWKLNRETVVSLARHLRRHTVPVHVLKTLALDIRSEFPAFRVDEEGELRARVLIRVPVDLPLYKLIRGPGVPKIIRAGWYMREPPREPLEWPFPDVVGEEHVQAIGEKISVLLARYPLRGATPSMEKSLGGIPAAFSVALGMYSEDMLGWMLEVKEERARSGGHQGSDRPSV